jgi:hypothetical protein
MQQQAVLFTLTTEFGAILSPSAQRDPAPKAAKLDFTAPTEALL